MTFAHPIAALVVAVLTDVVIWWLYWDQLKWLMGR